MKVGRRNRSSTRTAALSPSMQRSTLAELWVIRSVTPSGYAFGVLDLAEHRADGAAVGSLALPATPKPAPPTAEQTKPCHGRSTNLGWCHGVGLGRAASTWTSRRG